MDLLSSPHAGVRRRQRSGEAAQEEEDGPVRPAKKPRIERPDAHKDEGIAFTLYVRWFGPAGQTKVTALPLRAIDGVDALPVSVVRASPAVLRALRGFHEQRRPCARTQTSEGR
jgi:hypothetical protein